MNGIGVHKQIFGMNGFELACEFATTYCIGAPNSIGPGAVISAAGSASLGTNNLVLSSSPVPNQPGIFLYGAVQSQTAFGHGFLCVSAPLNLMVPPLTAVQNQAVQFVDYSSLPAGGQISAGSTWHFQHWYRDPAFGGPAFNTSNALSITFAP